jgi:predicted DNA-binding transcriptional regulator AlpA
MHEQTKAAVTVSEMARMVHLSRARFYQLMKEGVFPPPVYLVSSRRPVYVEDLQKVCLEVRRRNCGVNGKPVLFYSVRHPGIGQSRPTKRVTKAKPRDQYPEITAAVQALGLSGVTGQQVGSAMKSLYPNGVNSHTQPEVIRSVFLHLQRQESCR